MCGNGLPFVVAYLAMIGIGAVAVPLNPASPALELTHQLGVVGAAAAFVDHGAGSWHDIDRGGVAVPRAW